VNLRERLGNVAVSVRVNPCTSSGNVRAKSQQVGAGQRKRWINHLDLENPQCNNNGIDTRISRSLRNLRQRVGRRCDHPCARKRRATESKVRILSPSANSAY
jgi:hypothetical protein